MPRDASLSNSQCEFFQSGVALHGITTFMSAKSKYIYTYYIFIYIYILEVVLLFWLSLLQCWLYDGEHKWIIMTLKCLVSNTFETSCIIRNTSTFTVLLSYTSNLMSLFSARFMTVIRKVLWLENSIFPLLENICNTVGCLSWYWCMF